IASDVVRADADLKLYRLWRALKTTKPPRRRRLGRRDGKDAGAGYDLPVGSVVRGWGLARKSLRVVLADASLWVLVVLGAITSVAVAAAVFVPAALSWSSDRWLAGVLIVAGTYLTTAVGVFFAVALVAAAADVLDGRDATVARSTRLASTRLGPI